MLRRAPLPVACRSGGMLGLLIIKTPTLSLPLQGEGTVLALQRRS